MRYFLTAGMLFCFVAAKAQLYSWTSGVNPGWTSSSPSINTLSWQAAFGAVSTSDIYAGGSYTYNNSQITTYTSPLYNFTSCATSSYVQVTINLYIFLENRYDWLYFQYSTNGGTTWVNPVALSGSNNLSNVNLSGYAPLTAWASNASNRNGWTGNLGSISPSYLIPKTANRFRFIFASDVSGNSTFGVVYSADITGFSVVCPVLLPVEVTSFSGMEVKGGNQLIWKTESERPGVVYTIEKSTDGYTWDKVGEMTGQNTGAYTYGMIDETPARVVNYYRLSYVDTDGSRTEFEDYASVDNRIESRTVMSVVNLFGQPVAEDTPGVVIIRYTDGETVRKFNP